MKKELLWAACLSAVLGTGVLLLSGGNDPQGGPWKPLNDQLQKALAIQEGTFDAPAENDKEERSVKRKSSEAPLDSVAEEPENAGVETEAEAKAALPASAEAEATKPEASLSAVAATDAAADDTVVAAALQPAAAAAPIDDGKIHINSADAAALMQLPGIGEKKAQAILDYRAQNGPFRNVTDIVKVKGIGAKMLEKMLPDLAL